MNENLEYYENWFPPRLKQHLEFRVEGNFVVAKPLGFLGSETFAEIAKIVKDHGGEYVSLGKMSHFRFSVEQRMDREQLVKDALAYIQHAGEKLREAGY